MMGCHRWMDMHPHQMAIEVWCEETWGERPVRISEWANHDEIVQVLIRLSSSVLIADFLLDTDGKLNIQQHLHVPLETWNPGSIQGLRTSEGKTRFQHRRQSIYLSSELRVPRRASTSSQVKVLPLTPVHLPRPWRSPRTKCPSY